MSNQVVEVRRETITACMTCPLCNRLFRDATTISECLHTFCRKCIHKKLSDEELEYCPICNIDLGCVPLEKLRPDHNMQDLRAKIFPFKRRKVKAHEVLHPLTLPVRRKERSLSSLVVSTPRVSPQAAMTGRRSKSIARKPGRGSNFSIEKPLKKEDDSTEERPESSSSPETLNTFTQNIKQGSSTGEPSSHQLDHNEKQNGNESWEEKADLWTPLTCLVEVANRSKSPKFTPQGCASAAKSEPQLDSDNEGHIRKTKIKEQAQKFKFQDGKKGSDVVVPMDSVVKPKRLRRFRPKKTTGFGELRVSPQAVIDAANFKHEKRINPIWFSLVASDDQDGDACLPQISASYLRIKDGNVPVSFIQKYLITKLNLANEDEVEIKFMGRSVLPTLQLNNLVDLWLRNASPSLRVPAVIGSSAKDFVMVLAYARRVSAS